MRFAEGWRSKDIFVPESLHLTKLVTYHNIHRVTNEFILVDLTENLGDFRNDGVIGSLRLNNV